MAAPSTLVLACDETFDETFNDGFASWDDLRDHLATYPVPPPWTSDCDPSTFERDPPGSTLKMTDQEGAKYDAGELSQEQVDAIYLRTYAYDVVRWVCVSERLPSQYGYLALYILSKVFGLDSQPSQALASNLRITALVSLRIAVHFISDTIVVLNSDLVQLHKTCPDKFIGAGGDITPTNKAFKDAELVVLEVIDYTLELGFIRSISWSGATCMW